MQTIYNLSSIRMVRFEFAITGLSNRKVYQLAKYAAIPDVICIMARTFWRVQ